MNDYLNISLPANDGNEYKLSDFLGKRIILYFYPKDNTSGCTLEAISFTELIDAFQELNAVVIGVSRDSVKSHINFINKHNLKLLLLSDKEEKLVKAFDVLKEKSMYGRKYIGIERSTFIINENGKIVKEYRKVKAKGHALKVLEDLRNYNH